MKKQMQAYFNIKKKLKMETGITLIFCFATFLFTSFLAVLNQQQFIKKEINERWQTIFKAFPHTGHDAYKQTFASFKHMFHELHQIKIVLIGSLILVVALFTLISAQLKNSKIRKLGSLGLKKGQIIRQVLLETVVPFALSTVLLFSLLIIFYQSYTNGLMKVSEQTFVQTNQTEVKPSLKDQTNPKKKVFLPFNQNSLTKIDPSIQQDAFSLYKSFASGALISLVTIWLTVTLTLYGFCRFCLKI